MAKRRKSTNFQFHLFNWIMHIFLVILVLRLVQIQVIQRAHYMKLSTSQEPVYRDVQPKRGRIFDRNYEILAFNVPAVKIVANTDSIKTPFKLAHDLAPIVSLDANYLYEKLKKGKGWIELTRIVPLQVGDRVKKLNSRFVLPRPALQRYYPQGKSACQVVGFTRADGSGGNGIEIFQDSLLAGRKGTAVFQKTGRSRLLPHPRHLGVPAENGADVVLTIHSAYQKIVEEELAAAVYSAKAKNGVAVVIEPSSGDILAISSVPMYDPNNYSDYANDSWKLCAITDQFEPGSTFKIASMAAMLEAGFIHPEQVVFCENGSFKAWDRVIKDTSPHGDLTAHDIVVYSSNIGMAKLAKDFEKNTFFKYLNAFGFGQKCNIGLPGETSGTLKNAQDWYPFDNMAMAYGYGVDVSALQMCSLYATVANKGVRVNPRLLLEFRQHDGNSIYTGDRSFKRVMSEGTADILTEMMADVVDHGTGTKAQIQDIAICGKTGTAHIARSDIRGYSDRYFSSFGGFFPKDDPRITIFIMIRDPQGAYYGGSVAAPCFKNIADRIIQFEGKSGFISDTCLVADLKQTVVPNLIGFTKKKAVSILHELDLAPRFTSQGDLVMAQEPQSGEQIPEDGLVYLSMNSPQAEIEKLIPQVVGLPLRNAVNVLAASDLKCSLEGSGMVVKQQPAAGQVAVPGQTVKLYCKAAI